MERRIQSVDRAMSLLEALRLAKRPLGLKELSAATGLNPATAHLLLRTMAAHHFVDQDPDSREYGLGLAIIEAGQRAGRRQKLSTLLVPYARQLHEASGETVYVRMAREGHIYSLFEIEGTRPIVARPGRAFRSELRHGYAFATGKIFLAAMPLPDVWEALGDPPFKAFTPHTMTSRDAVVREVALVRRRGYALDREELIPGISCVAVPVVNSAGRIAATMSTSFPASTATDERIEELTTLLVETARSASGRIRAAGCECQLQPYSPTYVGT